MDNINSKVIVRKVSELSPEELRHIEYLKKRAAEKNKRELDIKLLYQRPYRAYRM